MAFRDTHVIHPMETGTKFTRYLKVTNGEDSFTVFDNAEADACEPSQPLSFTRYDSDNDAQAFFRSRSISPDPSRLFDKHICINYVTLCNVGWPKLNI